MFKLFPLFVKSHMESNLANPFDAICAFLSMFINNVIFFIGTAAMLFWGRPENIDLQKPFFVSQTCLFFMWGLVSFFLSGWRDMGDLIDHGQVESYLAMPQSAPWLVGLSKSDLSGLGDVVCGCLCLTFLGFRYGFTFAFILFIASLSAVVAFAASCLIVGSLGFWLRRAAGLGELVNMVVLTVSGYPSHTFLTGHGKWVLYFTPALLTAYLPQTWALDFTLIHGVLSLVSSGVFLWAALKFFQWVKKFYTPVSLHAVL